MHTVLFLTHLSLRLLSFRDSSHNTEQPGPSSMQTGPNLNWMESGQALTFIGHQVGAVIT